MKIRDDIYLLASGKLGFDWTDGADCNVYLIDTGAGAVIVDTGAGGSVPQIEAHARSYGFEPEDASHILLTHLHADHSGGARALRERTGARVAALGTGADRLEAADETAIDLAQARAAGFYDPDYAWTGSPVDLRLADGDRLEVGDCLFKVYHTPGHSAFDTCYVMERPGFPAALISGDAVLYGGRISMLGTSDFDLGQLARSIGRLSGLPCDLLLPGHGQPALKRGAEHILAARAAFDALRVPPNI